MRVIDVTEDEVERAKKTAIALVGEGTGYNDTIDMFFSNDLSVVENGIKKLNEFSSKAWILSSILIYSIVYKKDMFLQSGLSWPQYISQARKRLGIEKRDVTEQISSARFFIKNYQKMIDSGFDFKTCNRKLARAELATDLCKDVDETIKHLNSDTWIEFKNWYSSFKKTPKLEQKNEDIDVSTFSIRGKKAVIISDDIDEEYKAKIETYINKIFTAMSKGYVPAIVECYDENEASTMNKLRDKRRMGR